MTSVQGRIPQAELRRESDEKISAMSILNKESISKTHKEF